MLSTFCVHRKGGGALMRSAIWKCPNPTPGATDKDVLVFSQDEPHVFFLICEADGGIRPAS